MKTSTLIDILASFAPDSEVHLVYWNGKDAEASSILMMSETPDGDPALYAEGWDNVTAENCDEDPDFLPPSAPFENKGDEKWVTIFPMP